MNMVSSHHFKPKSEKFRKTFTAESGSRNKGLYSMFVQRLDVNRGLPMNIVSDVLES